MSHATKTITAETLTATEIARAAEQAAPGRVSYDWSYRPNEITIVSADGDRKHTIGLTDDLEGGECWLSVTKVRFEDARTGEVLWSDEPSDTVDTIADVLRLCE